MKNKNYLGQMITVNHKLTRVKGERTNYWMPSHILEMKVMVVGVRMLSNGELSPNTDPLSSYRPTVRFRALLVTPNLQWNPFYVLHEVE